MRISDWSSDVCSSDLRLAAVSRSGRRAGGWTGKRDFLSRLPAGARLARDPIACNVRLKCHAVRRGVSPPSARLPRCETRRIPCSPRVPREARRSAEHTSELKSLMRISYAVFCLKKKNQQSYTHTETTKKQNSNIHHKSQ